MHFDKAFDPAKEDDESESRMIVMTEENLYLMSVFVNNGVDLSAEHIGLWFGIHIWDKQGGSNSESSRLSCSKQFMFSSEGFRYGIGYEDKGSGRNYKILREEKLVAQFDQPYPYGLSYYITTMLEAEKVSWSKFTLSSYDKYSILDDIHIRLSFGGFYEEKKVPMNSGQRLNCYLYHYIGGDGYGVDYIERELPAFEDRIWRECVCFYVPSLVQIKHPKGGQREKKQSDHVEKLRFDEMMWRLSYFERRCKKVLLELAKKKASACKKISYPRSVRPEKARPTSFLSTNSFASLASSDDEEENTSGMVD
ncbi:unnamed protein product [Microthlaspi erraticum]|uniref:F-box associated beta-propeller type 1 domain-containing protein n=1 Tax=Microthlaspi erraticum TaxID=1685480 RepID=A0A6D2KKU5_9BRAS|nr:unnamed protein product [Microthlaspi erraticum]